MEPVDVVQSSFDDVYGKRQVSAASQYLADPYLRLEHGQLVEMWNATTQTGRWG